MHSKGKRKSFIFETVKDQKSPILKSFGYAFKGLSWACKERNFKLHILSAIACISLAFYCDVSSQHWCILLICIAAVMSLEIVNTALEKLVDMVSPDWNEKAGKIKDLAAAAVLLVSIASLVIGLLIFVPYLRAKFA